MPTLTKLKYQIPSVQHLQRRKKLGKLRIVVFMVLLVAITLIYVLSKKKEDSSLTTEYYSYYFLKNVSAVRPEVLCHYLFSSDTLPDITTFTPKKDKSIFFVETSCRSHYNGKITINSRQACAVESAAKLNPDYDIYLLYASPGKIHDEGTESDRFLQQLLKYPNIKIFYINIEKYVRDTPVENLWKDGALAQSDYVLSHTSDVLRFLTLWKYGGIYMDLDVVVIKNLKKLGLNFVAVENDDYAGSAVISFDSKEGYKFANSCLYDLQENYRGDKWAYNGPGTVTRFIRRVCKENGLKENNLKEIIGKSCNNFKIYPSYQFYAIPYWKWQLFVDENKFNESMELTKNSHIIHLWNKLSSSKKIPLNRSESAYMHYAEKYCPNIVKECREYF